ncbi:unnamed protein product, partial [Oppiella nova]
MAGPMARTDWDRFCHKVDKNFWNVWKDMNDWGKGVEKFFTDGPITPVFKLEFNGLKSSVRQEWDQKAKESNGLREELLALKASKLEAEVKALRDEIKDSNDMNVKDVKDLRQELMSLKALNETMICENKELTQELMSLNISCADSESNSDGNESQNSLINTFGVNNGETNAVEMLNEIQSKLKTAISLMNGMNEDKDNALTALEEIRKVMDNTDTESTAS